MAYERQNFEDGQKLKAEHLNKIETGLTDIWSNMQGISNDHREDIAQIQKDVTELENISKDHQEMLNDHKIRLNFVEQDIERVDTEITKLKEGDPKPVTIDFSNFDNGSFTVDYEDGTVSNHTVTFDTAGNPVSIDDMTIVWGAE